MMKELRAAAEWLVDSGTAAAKMENEDFADKFLVFARDGGQSLTRGVKERFSTSRIVFDVPTLRTAPCKKLRVRHPPHFNTSGVELGAFSGSLQREAKSEKIIMLAGPNQVA
jgi:hypothetical protein